VTNEHRNYPSLDVGYSPILGCLLEWMGDKSSPHKTVFLLRDSLGFITYGHDKKQSNYSEGLEIQVEEQKSYSYGT